MEKIEITDFFFYDDPDLSELDLFINSTGPEVALNVPVNDETDEPYHVDLRINPDTHKIVGATILYSDNLFQELARAFANKDLDHPDVLFFLAKKLEAYAAAHADELDRASAPLESSAGELSTMPTE